MTIQRLLFLAERFPPDIGGVATSAGRISQQLCQLGIKVDVLVWSRQLQPAIVQPPNNNDAQLPVYRVGLYKNWDMTMNHTINVLDDLHQTYSYDAVWGHYLFPAGFLAVWFASLNGIFSIVSARGNDIDRAVFPPGDFARLRWTLEEANLITTASEDLARKVAVIAKRKNSIALKNAVNTDSFKPSLSLRDRAQKREALGIHPEEVVLAFCGELREKKGQQFLLEALSQVRKKRPACLLIIGEVRQTRDAVLEVYSLQNPEDGDRVIVTGHLSQSETVAEYLQLADIFLLPSVWDGLPNALLEAMACQCCCIASDAGGIPEVITQGKTGFILMRSQLHQLGEAILECLQLSIEERNAIGKAAREEILETYSLEAERSRLKSVISNQ